MGCDIHGFLEVRKNGKWELAELKGKQPFSQRHYITFGFLAGVRRHNIPTVKHTSGLPTDSEYLNSLSENIYMGYAGSKYIQNTRREEIYNDMDYHSHGFVLLKDLSEFDYDQVVSDYNESLENLLGVNFFEDIYTMRKLGGVEDVRFIYWFDN